MRRYLGLSDDLVDHSPAGRTIPLIVPLMILLVTYNVLNRPWWQEMVTATAGIFVAGIVTGMWPRKTART